VADAQTHNHNADVGLNKNKLKAMIGDVTLELPCGRFYLAGVGGVGKLTIKVDGRTALFVDGDFILTGDMELDIGDKGELDVFVAGNLALTGANDFGDQIRPAKIRFYVAGLQDVTITGSSGFVGNLYAPHATVVLTGASYVYGAVFAGNFLAMGDTGIHYDREILNVGEDCDGGPADECLSAGDNCLQDSDCCEPLICTSGKCDSLIVQ